MIWFEIHFPEYLVSCFYICILPTCDLSSLVLILIVESEWHRFTEYWLRPTSVVQWEIRMPKISALRAFKVWFRKLNMCTCQDSQIPILWAIQEKQLIMLQREMEFIDCEHLKIFPLDGPTQNLTVRHQGKHYLRVCLTIKLSLSTHYLLQISVTKRLLSRSTDVCCSMWWSLEISTSVKAARAEGE